MKRNNLLLVLTIALVLNPCLGQLSYAQKRVRNADEWTALLENGKQRRKTGIILAGVGLSLLGIFAVLPTPKPDPGFQLFSKVSAGQVITGLGGFALTPAGIITLLSGVIKVHRARVGLETMSYYMHPRQSIQAPALGLRWQLVK